MSETAIFILTLSVMASAMLAYIQHTAARIKRLERYLSDEIQDNMRLRNQLYGKRKRKPTETDEYIEHLLEAGLIIDSSEHETSLQ